MCLKSTIGGILLGFVAGLVFSLLMHYIPGMGCHKETDIEIYTPDNIYYIRGLEVTNENDDTVLLFGNMESLSDYIEDVTSKGVQL